jgi:integrase
VSKLGKARAHHLVLRRSLGFKLRCTETRLRQFLAFMEGKLTTGITTALALEFATAASQDRKTAIGRRDYAIPLILAHLGLRAGEIKALTWEDLD